MTAFVALLRAVNVGGTGMLPMTRLAAICTGIGLGKVRTYIQSGNVVFASVLSEAAVREALEAALAEAMGKRIDVAVRDAAALRAVLEANPFPHAEPAKIGIAFGSVEVPEALVAGIVTPGGEAIRAGRREVYIHYPDGMGRSKLKLPAALGAVTVRNLNTVGRLAVMAAALE
jgi:uncharacterized protein (DUF1697 family)